MMLFLLANTAPIEILPVQHQEYLELYNMELLAAKETPLVSIAERMDGLIHSREFLIHF